MSRQVFAALLPFCAAVTLCLYAQQKPDQKDPLTFEVASVKPSAPGGRGGLIRPMPGNTTYHAEGVPLRLIMTVAYTVTDRQIVGGPAWIATDRFDIEAKAARPRTNDELHIMLQHLLEERFHMKLRHEMREEPVYAMVVNKGGAKMPVHDPEDKDYPPFGGGLVRSPDGGVCPGINGTNVTMDYFAFYLSRRTDRKVLDRTGLPGRYDVNLQYLPDGVKLGEGDNTPTVSTGCTDLFSAMPKQLGLKLESTKGPVDFLVIEHVEKPTEN